MKLILDNKAMKRFSAKLNTLHKSALPIAIRQTLDNAAFDVKANTMPAFAKKTFIQRKPNFFKANSKVEKAQGFNVVMMKSTVGFIPKDEAVKELKQQEEGGQIKNRTFISNKKARVGGSWSKNVRAGFRLSSIDGSKILSAKNSTGKSAKQKFIRTAIMAKKLNPGNALMIGNSKGGVRTLSKINTLKVGGGKVKITRTPLYSIRKGRAVSIKATNFMKRASMESGMKLEKFYIQNAQKQVQKYLK